MSTPTTAAGRALLLRVAGSDEDFPRYGEAIAAIEAEAAAAARASLTAELDALTWGRVFPGEWNTTRELVVFQKTVGHIRRAIREINRRRT